MLPLGHVSQVVMNDLNFLQWRGFISQQWAGTEWVVFQRGNFSSFSVCFLLLWQIPETTELTRKQMFFIAFLEARQAMVLAANENLHAMMLSYSRNGGDT